MIFAAAKSDSLVAVKNLLVTSASIRLPAVCQQQTQVLSFQKKEGCDQDMLIAEQ